MKQKLGGVFVCCGIDWITVTQRPCEAMELLREQAFALAAAELSSGEFGRPWASLGYEGFSVGHVFYGERYDGCLFQLTSHVAASHWRRAYENSCNVTRLDIQATVRTTEDPYDVIRRHYKEMQKRNSKLRKPPKLRIVCDDPNAVTVYSGSPKSDARGCIYDKGRQSKEKAFENCARYEVRLRGDKAKAQASGCFRRGASAAQIALSSLAFFAGRGACVRSLTESIDNTASIDASWYPSSPSTLERKQAWLEKFIRPTVLQVRERIGVDATLELLGLH